MVTGNRSSVTGGLLLILAGLFFLALQLSPTLWNWINPMMSGALIVMGVGMVLLVYAILGHVPGTAVPAAVVGGIGGLLYWQDVTGNWASWAYCWTLIPGFAGIGIILMGLLGEQRHQSIERGLGLILVSAVMFTVFGSLMGAFGFWAGYWPLLLILLGLLVLVRPMLHSR